MTKKDYQALAAAIHRAMMRQTMGDETIYPDAVIALRALAEDLAFIMAAENPRFDRERFLEACETGKCRGMRQVRS